MRRSQLDGERLEVLEDMLHVVDSDAHLGNGNIKYKYPGLPLNISRSSFIFMEINGLDEWKSIGNYNFYLYIYYTFLYIYFVKEIPEQKNNFPKPLIFI